MSKERLIQMCEVKNYLHIDKIKLHETNPRMISADRMRDLKLSIANKGFYEPILVWSKDNVVLSGNHRVMAAKMLMEEGYTFVSPSGKKNVLPVVVEDVPDEVAEAILYETNNDYAMWVEEKLQAALLEAQAAGRNLREFGFTDTEINDLLQTSLKDVESAAARGSDDYDSEKVEDEPERAKSEPTMMEAWLLPVELHDRLLAVFGRIAEQMSPHRDPTESLFPVVGLFCDRFEDVDDLVELMGDEA